ncbi:hypothetical protein JL2886_01551 [Phaeobacter gallaeciensis]|uniref:Uncharacterized protein n=1 Tax=Phaeobacter gallaeciensis TaxID=60890 RepID=A0A1B0ZQN6_9RHOB|nr:hypothetical protein JL2886_01551 [Phaeobacter gallaeciensis]
MWFNRGGPQRSSGIRENRGGIPPPAPGNPKNQGFCRPMAGASCSLD